LRSDGTGGADDPVIGARELCRRAQPGEAVVSDLVRALVGTRGGFQFDDTAAATLDETGGGGAGLAARTLAWSPPADAPAIPLPGPIGHLPTVFVGRRSELAEIDGVLTRLASGERRVVLVSGEPGIGKTSLVGQFARQAHAAGANVLYGRCDEETLVPYQPFVEAFARYAEVRPVEHLDAELGRHRAELARLVPRLEAEVTGFGMASEDVELDRYRMFEAVAAVLGTLSDARPTVLVLDDLHWADTPTLLLLRHLARHATPTSLLMLGTYRDTDLSRSHPLSQSLADLRRDQLVTRVHLSGLSLHDVVALLAETAGHEVGPPDRELGNTLWRETDGNPYFVREIVQHLTETGALDRAGGRWPRDLGVDGSIIPEGVKEVIGRRLSRLSEPANRCLRIASVMGREFGVEELTAVVELPADDVLDALDEAADAGLVAELAESTGRYEFSHMLLRQTLYEELTTARRLRLHRRIGEVLEQLHAEHLDRHLAELAHHFFEAAPAGEVDKAMDYAIRAGDRAMGQLAFEAAGRLYGMALDTADDADVGPEARCDVLLRLGDAEWRAGDGVTARALFEQAFALACQAPDPERLGRAALGFAGAGVRMWWVDVGIVNQKLIDMFEDALGALSTDDGALRARLMGALAQELYFVSGSRARRDQLSSDAVAMARRVGHQATLAHVLANRNLAVFGPDNVEEGLEIGTEVVALGTALANREMVAYGHAHRFMAHMQLGDIASAYREFELGSQLLEELRQPAYQQIRVIAQAMKAQTSGRLDEADALAREAFALGQETRDANAALILANQMYAILRDRGELEVLYGSLGPFAEFYPTLPGLRAMLGLASKELGNDEDARRQLEILGADGYAAVPRDFLWLATMCHAAEVCGAVGTPDAAAELYELLTPHAGRNALQPFGSLGSTSSALGILAGVLGRYDDAERHFADAVDMNTRLGAEHLVARTRAQHAEMLVRRDGGAARAAPPAAAGKRRVVGRHARAALTTRGRSAMARLLRDATDEDLVRRFSSAVAQRALFALIARSFDARQARGFEGDLVYELLDTYDSIGATSSWWTLEVRGRRASSRRGTSTDAVLIVHIGLAPFIRLVAGELHPITALTRGLCRIDGDVMLAGRLVEMFGGGLPRGVTATDPEG
jgi:predicted ATPase